MPMANGFPIIAALPVQGAPNETIILVDRQDESYDRYVTGRVRSTDFIRDSIQEWHAGYYTNERGAAFHSLLSRAGLAQ